MPVSELFKRREFTRRRWMKSAAGIAALAASGLPKWFVEETLDAAEVQPTTSPNDKPNIALIGCGGRGRSDAHDASAFGNVVAVCDVDDRHSEGASLEFHGAKAYHDFRDVIARDDIHVVINATPDHWHTLVNIHALKHGKDIYGEKPLTLTIDEGKHLVDTVKQTNRILQVGTQQRSDPNFRLACEAVRNGRLGKLKEVMVVLPTGLNGGPFKAEPVPQGLDWNTWQGQTQPVPYVPQRCHMSFRYWYDYSGGTMTDWGAHHNDIARWGIGLDGPTSIEGKRIDNQIPDSYTAAREYHIEYTWANGVRHHCVSTPSDEWNGGHLHDGVNEQHNGVKFYGSNGWIFVTRGQITASMPEILSEPFARQDAERLYASDNHMGNFFECVHTRKQPAATAEIGHRSVTVCHLGVLAMRLGRKLEWDPAKQSFVNDNEADKWLSREMRKGFDYDAV